MSPLRPSGGVGSSRPGASHLAQTPTGHRTARGPASVAACALIATLTLSGGAALADGNGAGDSAQSGATTETASTDEVTAQVVPVASDTAESTTDTTTPVSSDAASGLSALSSATSSAADTPDPDDGTELIEYFTFFVFPVSGPFNDDVQVSQNWGTVIFDSNDAWSRGENPLVITVSAAPGYRLQPDQKTVWEFWDEPEVTTIPSFSLPTEVDDTTWEPTLPDGVAIDSDTGWKDGARVITVTSKDGYVFTDGQQTEFTVTVKEASPVEPTAPVEMPSAAPVSPSQGNDKAKSDDSSSTTKAAAPGRIPSGCKPTIIDK